MWTVLLRTVKSYIIFNNNNKKRMGRRETDLMTYSSIIYDSRFQLLPNSYIVYLFNKIPLQQLSVIGKAIATVKSN